MKFWEFNYKDVNIENFEKDFNNELDNFKSATNFKELKDSFEKILKLRNDFSTMSSLANIRFSIDTRDEFYKKAKELYDEISPRYSNLINTLYLELVNSKFRKELENEYGTFLFKRIDVSLKTFKPEIIEDLQNENKLATKYDSLIASAKIDFRGKTYTLSQLAPFAQNVDSQIRKEASLAAAKFFEDNLTEFDQIYDELVKVRHQIALKLGYKNFIQLGYDRLERTDYDQNLVNKFRLQILESVVPICQKLYKRQSDRLKIDNPMSYDYNLSFLSGNPKPIGNKDILVNQAKKLYDNLSPETSSFFKMMLEQDLLDLESKDGKSPGGYCAEIANYKVPFIFANFNGTSHDVDVLTHEIGHAFQYYSTIDKRIPEYTFPTLEAAEIHSMSMEFFAYNSIDLLVGEDAQKYRFNHLDSAIKFLPYGALVDHFQHVVYENPDLTPQQRREKWRELEKQYMPHRKYDDIKVYEEGATFIRQGHIFAVPFYYIDYALAQFCALQFFSLIKSDYNLAWQKYINLCQLGGSKSFLNLLKMAELKNPFEDKVLDSIAKDVEDVLNQIDDSKF